MNQGIHSQSEALEMIFMEISAAQSCRLKHVKSHSVANMVMHYMLTIEA